MNFRPRRRESPEINMMPLIDVVFLLLIFFMVSTTFDKQTKVKVALPEAAANYDVTEDDPKFIDVTIDISGRYFINDQEVINKEVTTLTRALEKASKGDLELSVVVNADKNTTHQAVVRLMDAASRAGLTSVTFATREPAIVE